jgi:lycopene cyclase domain-containing protein
LILGVALAGPLILSFDKKVAFYKEWKYVFKAMILPAFLYILWDIYFTGIHVWSFNPAYITGIMIINLPIEEILFFFIIPYCCLFIYVCIRSYFPAPKKRNLPRAVLIVLAAILLFAGILFYEKQYTSYTFILLALFIILLVISRNFFHGFNITTFLISYAVILFPFLIVNGFLTAIPVVLYNNAENLGVRIYTIPFEDVFYGMLLVMMNIAGYEKLKSVPNSK